MSTVNQAWKLESFVDALVVELDKTRETLAVKAMNRPLSYSVKDMALDLQIFPTFDGDEVQFTTAQAGESGASKLSLQLASITDQQVRATSKKPVSRDDIKIEQIDVDPETKKTLRKLGVTSVNDLEEIEKRNVDLEKVTPGKINFTKLANLIQKSKRNTRPPAVQTVGLSLGQSGETQLIIRGRNLAVRPDFEPVAVVDNRLATVLSYDTGEIRVALPPGFEPSAGSELVVTTDPYSVFKINLI
jgi:hypothetical protein